MLSRRHLLSLLAALCWRPAPSAPSPVPSYPLPGPLVKDLLAIAHAYVAMCEDTFYDMDDMCPESKQLYDDCKAAIALSEQVSQFPAAGGGRTK